MRDRKNLMIVLLQPIIIAALISLIFLSSAPHFEESEFFYEDVTVSDATVREGRLGEVNDNIQTETNRQNDMNFIVLAFILSAIWSGASNSAREIVKETSIYKRERFINICIAPYILSKISMLAVICLLQSLLFVSIIAAILGFPAFLLSTIAFFMVAFASALMGLTISAIASNANVANSSLPILFMAQFILSGAIVPIEEVEPEFVQSIFYIIIGKWGYELVGGGICDINSLSAFDVPFQAFDGSFSMHWWILIGFFICFYTMSTFAMLKKDQDLS